MDEKMSAGNRTVDAVHGRSGIDPDPEFELATALHLKNQHSQEYLVELYSRFSGYESSFDGMMRRIIFRAFTQSCGSQPNLGTHISFKHPETFEIGEGVFIGNQANIQGRYDGRCIIGDHTWIGPQSFLDARDLVIEEQVGWGPGAKILGSAHTGIPADIPIIQTDLEIKPVRIRAWADIGTNAVILPGVTVGKGAIVGAGAVVTRDVEPFSVVAGVPAKFLHWREGYEGEQSRSKE